MADSLASTSSRATIRVADLLILTKVRITVMVAITAAIGLLAAQQAAGSAEGWPLALLFHTLFGTALVASAGAALNQVLERDLDANMRRTASRPLPAGRLDVDFARAFAVVLATVGLGYLAWFVNVFTAVLGALTLIAYVFIYTPLKRVSSLSTVVGAVPGAMPPLMGWAAYADTLGLGAWAIFGILFFWQLPHFLAIAWLYREDYARAGYPMLPVVHPGGESTARQAILWCIPVVPLSLMPTALGLTGTVYAAGALFTGLGYFAASVAFGVRPGDKTARRLMLASVLYLPALFGVLLLDRLLR